MLKSFSIFMLAVLVLPGCTSYQPAVMSGGASLTEENATWRLVVEVGDQVRMTTTAGQVVSGEVISLSGTEVVLGKLGNYGPEELNLPLSEIQYVEVEKVAGPMGFLGGTVAVVLIVAGSLVFFIGLTGGIGS
jgi:hypothetical protein|nr:hypothetical protein [Candidatus Krumholzibacteria bacterium]